MALRPSSQISGITIRCAWSRGPRGFFCLQVDRRGPVIVDVMRFKMTPQINFLNELSEDYCRVVAARLFVNDLLNLPSHCEFLRSIENLEKFGWIIWHALETEIVAGTMRLLDPEKSCGQPNLSLIRFCVENDHCELKSEVDEIRDKYRDIKTLRNKKVSHTDESHGLRTSEGDLPNVDLTAFEECHTEMRRVLEALHEQHDSSCHFDVQIANKSVDVNAFIDSLRLGGLQSRA